MTNKTLLVPLAVLLLSCSGGDQAGRTPGMSSRPGQNTPAPGSATIAGTVLSISDDRMADADSPCSQAPCIAVVRVDSVLGYGSGFQGTLARGTSVTIKFAFTLAPTTHEMFPDMTATYPGLPVGSSFRASVTFTPRMASEAGRPSYTVFDYTVLH